MDVHVFEHLALPVVGAGKRVGSVIVIVLQAGLAGRERREVVETLLTPDELAAYDDRDQDDGAAAAWPM